ncbi:unnamed protein product [Orchesella dallaii]|uniref:O-acyltransferase WSD1 C-terminal domain-containing protein n=1 Tax=Orchesella dallaii TaxID=48710 RepID=A0ABP1RHR7_9HEXA
MCLKNIISLSDLKVNPDTIQKYILGGICSGLFTIFIVISIPIYIFRYIVAFSAKWLRPDLSEILDPVSSLWVNDLYTGKPPRCSIIVPMTFQGQWTPEKFKQIILDKWINAVDRKTGDLVYEKLCQYPERWLGFTFWKHSRNKFNIENHAYYHESKGNLVTSEKLNELIEKLLNAPYPPKRSLWELHYVANYKNTQDKEMRYSSQKPMFALILKFHHSLGDGYSFMCAVTEGLCGHSLESLKVPRPRPPEITLKEEILKNINLLFRLLLDLPYEMGRMFEECPWKIEDENKAWWQLYGRSNLIPVKDIKYIKNAFGVSFASVIVSAMSFGIHKDLEKRNNLKRRPVMSSWSALPVPRRSKKLSNCFTGTLFDMPTIGFPDPISRLQACHSILQRTQSSSIPYGIRLHQIVVGSHLSPVCRLLSKNKMISTGLSNFPGIPIKIGINDAIGISSDFAVGAAPGNGGKLKLTCVGVSVQSYAEYIRIAVTAENAVMTREQVDTFIRNMLSEIHTLNTLAIAKTA